MPLNQPALQAAIYAAFRKQAIKPGPDKGGVEAELARDLSAAIQQFVLSGQVNVLWAGIGMGVATAPWPGIVSVFSIPAGVGMGFIR